MRKVWLIFMLLLLVPLTVCAEESSLDRTGFIATATSDWNDSVKAQNLMDGNPGTIWHADPAHRLPISVTIDMGAPQIVGGIRVTFRETETNGFFMEGIIYKSDDGETFTQIAELAWDGVSPVSTLWFHEEPMRYIKITVTKATAGHAIAREIELLRGGVPIEKQLYMDIVPTDKFIVSASSTKVGNEIEFAFDNDLETHWHSYFAGVREKPPYTIDINMGRTELISGIVYWPRESNNNGYFTKTQIYTSEDGKEYAYAGTAEWSKTYGRKWFTFAPAFAKYVRLVVAEATLNYGIASEISIMYDAEKSAEYKKTHKNFYVFKEGMPYVTFEHSDGRQEQFETQNALLVAYDHVYVPLRCLFELLGATVEWNGEDMSVAMELEKTRYVFFVEDKRFYRDDHMFTIDASPILVNNRVYMPIGFIRDFMRSYSGVYKKEENIFFMEVK